MVREGTLRTTLQPLARLRRLLRPSGGGIHTVSTGKKDQLRLQRRIYGAERDEDIVPAWHRTLDRVAEARVVILGIPSDVGAGFARGANFGPQSIPARAPAARLVGVRRPAHPRRRGRVRRAPAPSRRDARRPTSSRARGVRLTAPTRTRNPWPVSPLSIAQAALETLREVAPAAAPLVLGGDHSVGWPAAVAAAKGRAHEMGILHFDAHTDLLEHRLGVRYCFATWAFHANELIGRNRRMAQVGIRVSGKTREHWESTYGVRQYWMSEVSARSVESIAEEIVGDMRAAGVRGVYVSNDIDGTDPLFGLATGTPEPGGLDPTTVTQLIRMVTSAFEVWGSDFVEVAPTLGGHSPREPMLTLATAANYVEVQARATLDRAG